MEQNNQLYHHGIPGMKWGIRRYQNKDGSLTPAGRKRAAKLEDKYRKITGKKLDNQSNIKRTNKSKTAREMSDEELRSKASRIELENRYDAAIDRRNQLHPKRVSKGKAFVDKVLKDVIVPAATEAGKEVAKNYVKNILSSSSNTSATKKKITVKK